MHKWQKKIHSELKKIAKFSSEVEIIAEEKIFSIILLAFLQTWKTPIVAVTSDLSRAEHLSEELRSLQLIMDEKRNVQLLPETSTSSKQVLLSEEQSDPMCFTQGTVTRQTATSSLSTTRFCREWARSRCGQGIAMIGPSVVDESLSQNSSPMSSGIKEMSSASCAGSAR